MVEGRECKAGDTLSARSEEGAKWDMIKGIWRVAEKMTARYNEVSYTDPEDYQMSHELLLSKGTNLQMQIDLCV